MFESVFLCRVENGKFPEALPNLFHESSAFLTYSGVIEMKDLREI